MDDKTASILSQLLRESIAPTKNDLRHGIELLCSEHGLEEILHFHLMSEYGTKHLSKVRDKDLPDIWTHVRSMVHLEENSVAAKILKFPGA